MTHFFSQQPYIQENTKFGAIGEATAFALQQHCNISFKGVGNTQHVAKTFKKIIGNQTVLFPISNKSLRTVQKELLASQVYEIEVYRTELNESITIPNTDIIIFTSPSNVEAYFRRNNIHPTQQVIAIGHTTANALQKKGINQISIPWQSSELALVDILHWSY